MAIASRAPMLLTGPTGAGKSQLARRIYELKKARRQVEGAFVEVNCATLRGDARHVGAVRPREGRVHRARSRTAPGLLRKADGGVLFLDEIGELGADEQAMLLRAIEEKTLLPVGLGQGGAERLPAASPAPTATCGARWRDGRFREDLLARINLWTFRLPGLRERPEDIAPNLDYELDQASAGAGRARDDQPGGARALPRASPPRPRPRWSGNFRDFERGGAAHGDAGRRAGASPARRWTRRSRGCARSGRAAPAQRGECAADPVAQVLGAERRRSWTASIGCSSRRCCAVCRQARSLSEAGRALFAQSRARKQSTNDADRLRKYLARFGLSWDDVAGRGSTAA